MAYKVLAAVLLLISVQQGDANGTRAAIAAIFEQTKGY